MKKYLFFAAALVALASCSSDDLVGENSNSPNPNPAPASGEKAIVFNSGARTVTRADHTGSDAADMLNNQFVFAGTKTGSSSSSIVFDQYYAKWVTNTAHTTESNSNDWEYVGYSPYGVGNSDISSLPSGAIQSIKYWDYSTTQYDFAAYSLGKGVGTTPTYATASKIDMSKIGTDNGVYTLSGSADELKACYISDLVTAYNVNDAQTNVHVSNYGDVVTFSFRSLATKIRLAFYETIPGYSVKEMKFYTSENASLATDGTEDAPTLYVKPTTTPAFSGIPSGSGTMTISFPTIGLSKRNETDYNKAHVTFTPANTSDVSTKLVLEDLANLADAENKEASNNVYLGRASNAATYAGGLVNNVGKYYTILPYEAGANLHLRIKYTLVSTDGSNEEMTVDNATAVIPAELAKWNPNYAYTYIFKISDMTNGSTGTDGNGNVITGLTPITLNAVVVDSEDGVQETITTVSEPSITTYAQGKVVTDNNEYIAGVPIYIIVNNGTANETLTVKAKLYTVTLEPSTDAGDEPGTNASQPISEESIDNALANGEKDNPSNPTTWTVKDANKWKLVVTKSELMTLVSDIAAADSPTGNEINIGTDKVGKFTPDAAGKIYVFQYEVEPATTETYTETTAAEHNATLEGAITTEGTVYSFKSYGSNTGSPQYGDGKVKVVSQANGWTTVLVVSNSVDGFVGKTYKVNSTTLDADTYYELYTTAGAATGIYVKVATSSLSDTEVNTYNATLPGAVKKDDIKNIPAKYQYKIIKVQ